MAIMDKDEAAAKAQTNEGAWGAGGNSPSELFRQAVQKGFQYFPVDDGVALGDERAAVTVTLEDDDANVVGTMYMLLAQKGEGWKLEGAHRSSKYAALYIHGDVGPNLRVKELPADDKAAAFGARLIGLVQTADEEALEAVSFADKDPFMRLLNLKLRQQDEAGFQLSVGETARFEAVSRSAVQLLIQSEGKADDDLWFVLGDKGEGKDEAFEVLRWVSYLSLEFFFDKD